MTKDELTLNLEFIDSMHLILKALAIGLEIELDSYKLIMNEGQIYIKTESYNTKTKTTEDCYLNYSGQISIEQFMKLCYIKLKSDNELEENLKFQISYAFSLNKFNLH